MKITIGMASLADIAEKACKVYRQELAEAEYMVDINYLFENLSDVMKLLNAVNEFDCESNLLLTIEKREEQEDGTDRAD